MPNDPQGFDLLKYLGIIVNAEDKKFLREELMDQLSQFIIIQTIKLFPENKLENITSERQLFDYAQTVVPNFDSRVREFLEDFKKRYTHEAGNL